MVSVGRSVGGGLEASVPVGVISTVLGVDAVVGELVGADVDAPEDAVGELH